MKTTNRGDQGGQRQGVNLEAGADTLRAAHKTRDR